MGQHEHEAQAAKDKARGRGGKKRVGKLGFADYSFANIELDAEQKAEVLAMAEAGEFALSDLEAFIAMGCKISIKLQSSGTGVQIHASQTDPDHMDAGLILSAFGPDLFTALAVLTYKHLYVAGEDGWRAASDKRGGTRQNIG